MPVLPLPPAGAQPSRRRQRGCRFTGLPASRTIADGILAAVRAAIVIAGDLDEYAAYYVTEILRSPAAHERFCHPLRAE